MRGFLEQRVDRLRMHRAEHQRGRCAVAQEFVAKDARGCARKCLVGESLLSRIGVAIQPIQQLLALRADDSGLHEMDMRIDKARRDQMAAIIRDLCAGRQFALEFVVRTGGGDLAILDNDKPVALMPESFGLSDQKRIVVAPYERSTQCGRRGAHCVACSKTSAAPIACAGAMTTRSM